MNADEFRRLVTTQANVIVAATRTGAYVVISAGEAEIWLSRTFHTAKNDGQPPLVSWDERRKLLAVGGTVDLGYEEVTP